MRYLAALSLLLVPLSLQAQQAPAELSLPEALQLARQHNPEYQAQLNDEAVADWGVREAYASFLPTASVGGGLSYQSGGQARIGGFTTGDIGLGTTPDYYYSSYSLSLGLGLDGSQFYRVGQQKASRLATLAGMDAAAVTLDAQVTRQYLAVLRVRDAVELARAELERAEANLALAEARYEVEAATAIEAKQAAVERGRAQVEVLRSQAMYDTERLRLLQLMGVDLDQEVVLTTEVVVFEPSWELPVLVETAMATQPQLVAARATTESAEAGVGMARSAYWPRLSLSTGLSGYTRRASSDQYLVEQAQGSMEQAREDCVEWNQILTRLNPPLPAEDCAQYQFTPGMRQQIVSSNRQFPFNFETEPMSLSLGVSLPVFQGLSRQRQLEAAHAAADDARFRLRAQELQIRADVEAALRSLEAAYQAVLLEETNTELAADQLRLARERYRLGSASFLELMEAEALKARADRAYLLGVYSFQESLTALEAAVGQDLSVPGGE